MASPIHDGRHRTLDRSALPDPAVWRDHAHRSSLRRIGLAAVGLVLVLALSAVGLRAVLGRARSAGSLGGALTGLPRQMPGEPGPEQENSRRVSPEELAELQKSWIGSESIAPRGDRLDPSTGERVAPFQGFGLQIDSAPSGARVLVNGEEMGRTPLLTTVDCAPGDTVVVQLERAAQRGRAQTRCRKDALVKIEVSLAR